MPLAQVSEQGQRILDEVERAVVGKRAAAHAGPQRDPRRRSRAHRGLPRPGQDARRPVLRAHARAGVHPGAVHPRPAARRPHRIVRLRPARAGVRVPARAAVHRAAARRRDQPHAAEDPVGAARGDAGAPGHRRGPDVPARRARSTSSPPRTPSSTRAPTRCPRPSSTGSSCASPSGTRPRVEELDVLRNRVARQREEDALDRVTDAAGLLAMQDAVETVTVDDDRRPRTASRSPTATRDHQHTLLGASPRGSLALMLVGRAHAVMRGRDYVTPEDVKAVAHAGPRAPDHRQAGAVDEQRHRAHRRREHPRHGPDAVGPGGPTVVSETAPRGRPCCRRGGRPPPTSAPRCSAVVGRRRRRRDEPARPARPRHAVARRHDLGLAASTPGAGDRRAPRVGHGTLREGEATVLRASVTIPDGVDDVVVAVSPAGVHGAGPAARRPRRSASPRAGRRRRRVHPPGRCRRRHPLDPLGRARGRSRAVRRLVDVGRLPQRAGRLGAAAARRRCRCPPSSTPTAPMPHPRGLVGAYRSQRPGSGSEFDRLRPFQVGDRLRRIHWPVSLRTGTLHVTSTYGDEDSQVVLVVDATSDLGSARGPRRPADQPRPHGPGGRRDGGALPRRGRPGRPARRRSGARPAGAGRQRPGAPAPGARHAGPDRAGQRPRRRRRVCDRRHRCRRGRLRAVAAGRPGHGRRGRPARLPRADDRGRGHHAGTPLAQRERPLHRPGVAAATAEPVRRRPPPDLRGHPRRRRGEGRRASTRCSAS